ncbi:MAG: hypothetical protein LBU27_08950 [Candidatus Peribacteria bacterium]|jgi:hypothetical protein|nr:hypothetical protein [Candidatus Peribacteria bacterium]
MVDEYQLPLGKGEKVILPKELQHLNNPIKDWQGKEIHLTEEQKKRYLKKYEQYADARIIFQEYPTTPEEAFLTTGRTVFDSILIKNLITPPYRVDEVIPDLRIYRPAPKKQIVGGSDTCEGVIDGDFASIIIREPETLELLAVYYGRCPPEYLCVVIDRLIEL